MKGVKLFLLLKGLNASELKELKKAIQSPLYNTNERLIHLYEALRPLHPNFPETATFKKKLFRKTYPNEIYNDQKLRRSFSQLRAVTEQFLVYLQLNRNAFRKEKLLAEAYKDRQLPDFYKQQLELLIKQLDRINCLDVDLLRERALLAKESCYLHKSNFKQSLYNIQTFIHYLNRYFVAERCLADADFKVLEKTLGKQTPQPFSDFVHQMSFQIIDYENPNLQLYAQLSDLAEQAEEETFLKIKKFYFQHFNKLTHKDRLIVFTHLTNFCTNQINQGKKVYRNWLMNLYQTGLEKDLLWNLNGQLDAVIYRNIGMLAILNNDFTWANSFFNDFEMKLEKSERDSAKSIGMGFLHFYQHQYEETIDLLLPKDFTNINNILSAKDLILRSYFELFLLDRNYFSLFTTFAQSFSIYIKRKGIGKSKGGRYISLIKFLLNIGNKIYAIQDYKPLIKKWETDIHANQLIASKKWVLNKIESFKGQR